MDGSGRHGNLEQPLTLLGPFQFMDSNINQCSAINEGPISKEQLIQTIKRNHSDFAGDETATMRPSEAILCHPTDFRRVISMMLPYSEECQKQLTMMEYFDKHLPQDEEEK
ncbi:hypothetical protein KIN20_035827 [Parelaphostrongylus tenuis]|uniref:Uncharacterized protein n=1 Tax=Parelaphostrongylus tenuis TaxID=148309 RepID=A0AAD5WL79_PARTN|nr:hypothetical protein KIN20_035827 [Parelaphostrongylus tenuis]